MSSASAVLTFGRGAGEGRIERGPQHTIYAIHFSRPCLVTHGRLNSDERDDTKIDRMILDQAPVGRAATTAVMMLAEFADGTSPVLLYPQDPMSVNTKDELGETLRIEFQPEVRAAVRKLGPITLHIMRFDHELYGPATVAALRDLGIIVETFESNEQPADPDREWVSTEG
jgi:hypothetical protein